MAASANKVNNFTEGKILLPLVRFALPVLAALILQSLYGAVDLFVVGRFATSADVSSVSTGSQLMMMVTSVITSLSMGTTILLGHQIGAGHADEGGETIGASIALFAVIGVAMSLVMGLLASQAAGLLRAPEEAFSATAAYIRICGGGSVVIIAYNLIGSIFRGIGDSRTPLYAVIIATVANIAGDLILVAGLGLGAAGAAIATVGAQAVSVVLSLIMISRRKLPFAFRPAMIRFVGTIMKKIIRLGLPLVLSSALVDLSFLIILAIVNNLGLTYSAGVGVAEKVCGFIMLVQVAFMQSMAAFAAQNYGAGRMDRAVRALWYSIAVSLGIGVFMFYGNFFHGDVLSAIFTSDPAVIAQAFDYLKAYAIDCLLTPIFFCFIGFYNGLGMTKFVMAQGIISAFCVRVPVSFLMSRIEPPSLFRIAMATPCSSALQIVMGLVCYVIVMRKYRLAVSGRKAV